MKNLSIIIPGFSEAHRIEKSIETMKFFNLSWQKKYPDISLEILYVIEKSPDNTLEIAQRLTSGIKGFKVIGNEVQRGKGFAVQTGILKSSGDVKLFMDLDLSTDLTHVKEFYDLISSNQYDVVIGDRKSHDSQIIKKQPFLRRLASSVFGTIVSFVGLKGIKDTQCGFKAFSAKSANYLFNHLHFDGFSFDVEILYKARLISSRIKSCPVKWEDDTGSKVRLLSHGLSMLKDLIFLKFKIRPRSYRYEFHLLEKTTSHEKISNAS